MHPELLPQIQEPLGGLTGVIRFFSIFLNKPIFSLSSDTRHFAFATRHQDVLPKSSSETSSFLGHCKSQMDSS